LHRLTHGWALAAEGQQLPGQGGGSLPSHLSLLSGVSGKSGELLIDGSALGLTFDDLTSGQDALLQIGANANSGVLVSSSTNPSDAVAARSANNCTASVVGSKDGTREAVLSTRIEDAHLLLLSTPLFPVHRLSFPYHGVPGKGSAFRLIFKVAQMLHAKACIVVDSDLRSITPEWIDLLIRPVLLANYDFVAPYYHRHKYDGTITNSIVYPLTRSRSQEHRCAGC
jgi:hypothetical protein